MPRFSSDVQSDHAVAPTTWTLRCGRKPVGVVAGCGKRKTAVARGKGAKAGHLPRGWRPGPGLITRIPSPPKTLLTVALQEIEWVIWRHCERAWRLGTMPGQPTRAWTPRRSGSITRRNSDTDCFHRDVDISPSTRDAHISTADPSCVRRKGETGPRHVTVRPPVTRSSNRGGSGDVPTAVVASLEWACEQGGEC